MKKSIITLFIVMLAAIGATAQITQPIRWTQEAKMTSANEGKLTFSVAVDEGWHLYGFNLPEGGPNPTEIKLDAIPGVEWLGDIVPSRSPITKVDMVFHLKLSWWDSDVQFTQAFRLTGGATGATLTGTVRYQGCNDSSCIPPTKEAFSVTVGNPKAAAVTPVDTVEEDEAIKAATGSSKPVYSEDGWWAPVTFEAEDPNTNISQASWWYIFIWGFLGGLLALLTPCVWPMIPMTVSFFLKKTQSRAKSIGDALIYGLSIVVIYLVLGLLITMVFGASKLNDLSTNAVFNLAFFALLVIFAISFFGAFDITLPSKWSNAADGRAERTTGLISIFFMAFTLVLVSFSCTGPIIGTLLVEAASMGDITGPAIGMGAFALALALPFSLFAVFPSWLKEMPRSGGWLNSVKVVLGFLELALSLKFLSVADLAYGWGLLDREVFISLWVVIFALLGFYLLGKIQFSHDSKLEHVSVTRFFLALFSLSFAVYLIPGLWGAPLKGVSAFVPPLYTQDFNLYTGGVFEEFDNYDEGMRYAAENNRPVLIDFSGYGCVNCRKMEGAVFDTDQVSDLIKENFVLIKLMVDDKAALAEPRRVEEGGKTIVLETVGDQWSFLQRSKFGANSQPYYIMLNNDGQALSEPVYYDENLTKFVSWLENGLKVYAEQQP
ncbi:MAG: thioredoxin family protein [Bacteroidales bacterium]|nr:thioredoxin family protein [Bacteroidales bacterium]